MLRALRYLVDREFIEGKAYIRCSYNDIVL